MSTTRRSAFFSRTVIAALALAAAGALIAATAALADNPIIQTKYTADPAPLVHDDTVYLYTSHDEDNAVGFTMYNWMLYSSRDLVNWTDHGIIAGVRDPYKTFKWADGVNAWAPQVVYRNGKFYLYGPLPKGGHMVIGVAVADRPTGPFVDPLGRPLIDNPSSSYDIDPTVFIDGDGQAYLYWGHQPPVFYVKLNADMVSYSGGIVQLTKPQTYEEGPWMYKRSGRYYLAFASTCCPEGIGYAMSSSPTGPWTYKGSIMDGNSQSSGNHPGIIDFRGSSYLFGFNYDVQLQREGKRLGERRSVCLERMTYNADGTIPKLPFWSKTGAPRIANLDPYVQTEAETIAWAWDVRTEPCSEGGMDVTAIQNGDYIKVAGVDFGAGATSFAARVASGASGGTIQIRLNGTTGTQVGTCTVPGTGGWQSWTTVTCNVSGATGVRDLYLVFTGGSGSLFNFNWWRFSRPSGEYMVAVARSGSGSGAVTSVPAGISCGTSCAATFTSGSTVTLTAAPATGSSFAGWSGDCVGADACILSMTAARSVTATFTSPTGSVSVNAGGAASGAFAADAYYSGGSTYSVTTAVDTSQLADVVPPQSVLQSERYGEFTYTIPGLTAGAPYAVTLYFDEVFWTAAGQRTFDVAVNGSTALTAFDILAAAGGAGRAIARTFATTANAAGQVVIAFTKGGGPDNPKVCGVAVTPGDLGGPFPLSVARSGAGSGSVAGGPIDCGAICSATLAAGTLVTLTATPASGSAFAGWSGDCTGTGPCAVTMTAARSVTAVFSTVAPSYTLSVTKGGTGTGTVAGGAISCGATCSADVTSGTSVTLTATPATGSTFAGWSGSCSGTSTCVVSMTAARSVTATFNGTDPTCTTATGGQSGNFNTTGPVCYTVHATIRGWGCSNADGRTVTVNGTAVTCGQTPLPGGAPYTFSFGAGTYSWASFYWW